MMSSDLLDPENPTDNGCPEAKYANYFRVGHNAYEFVMDYGQSYGELLVTIHTRIIMAPSYARELLKVLQEAMGEYEAHFGSLEK
jgi:hypothetical protein